MMINKNKVLYLQRQTINFIIMKEKKLPESTSVVLNSFEVYLIKCALQTHLMKCVRDVDDANLNFLFSLLRRFDKLQYKLDLPF